MRKPLSTIHQHARTKGAAFVEYVVLLGILSVVVIFSVLQLGAGIDDAFTRSNDTVVTEIEDNTGITIGGSTTPGGPTGPAGDPLAPNTPGRAPAVGPTVALDFNSSFQTGSYLLLDCAQSAADPTGGNVWCSGDTLENRPSNLEWRTNTNQGAAIWQGQLCLYDTATSAFVTSVHYVYDQDNMTDVPGLAAYNGTWLMCQDMNQPSGGLEIDNTVAAWDGSESFWSPAPVGTRGTLPAEIPFTAPPAWSEIDELTDTECVYSNDMQRWLTYNMYVSGGQLYGDTVCQ